MLDISISNSKPIRRGNSKLATKNRLKRLKDLKDKEVLIFVGDKLYAWHGIFNNGFEYNKAKNKPYKATYEI